MSQSLSALYTHVVFSTKDRYPYRTDLDLRYDLHNYLGGISNHLGCQSLVVGGTEDHVHPLICLSRTVTISDWMREIKRGFNALAPRKRTGFEVVLLARADTVSSPCLRATWR